MDTSLEDSVRCMLRFGFPPDFDRAGRYLHDLLDPAAALPPQGHRPMHEVLEEIVGEIIEKSPGARIVIPLSEGLDSRGILGAALRIVPKDRILCVTYGRGTTGDVFGARTVAAALGVEWLWIDAERIPWTVPDIVERVGEVFARFQSYASQAVVRLVHIEREVGEAGVYLTGYLGGVITGGHLQAGRLEGAEAVALTLTKNATALDHVAFDVAGFAATCRSFAKRIRAEFGAPGSLTEADILDFGLRQAFRIKGTVCAYERVGTPYEDPRWVRYWLDQPIARRLSKRHYTQELRASYPAVYCLDRDRLPIPVARPGLKDRLRRYLRPSPSLEARLHEKAKRSDRKAPEYLRDFQVNPSVYEASLVLMESFDARRLVPEVSFTDGLHAALTNPTARNVDSFIQAGRVEAHLQAGTLGGDR